MIVRYDERAEAELLDALAWLESRATGLGHRLLNEVLRAEEHLRRFPDSSEEVREGIRRYVLRGFPYSHFYTMQADVLLILAFSHQRRRPDYWFGRIPPSIE